MKWYENIVNGGDGSYSVSRYRTIEEAQRAIQKELDWSGMEPDGPYLVDTDSEYFFDTVSEDDNV